MSKILEFHKVQVKPSVSGILRCFGCKHEWPGVFEPGTLEFECPACLTMKGRSKCEVVPADDEVYACQCGNNYFLITRKSGPLCVNCGHYHRPYDDPKGAA